MLALIAVSAAISAVAAGAQDKPAAHKFLIATHQQQGPFFETVILLVDYDQSGAMGLIVNRPSRIAVAKVLPQVKELEGRKDRLFVGGPVSLDHLMLLIRAKKAPPHSTHVVDDVYASGSIDTLRDLASGALSDANFRAYAGYAGWAAGQLDAELARGAWRVLPASANEVFTTQPDQLWQDLDERSKGILVDLAP
ncbi:MAG TPA: YqgE/AlgH family protein, partial [Thermoanaerobaculia bacterium]|nr:YqgE/AlgH family protein [Thermoanaerobaculia bacterium]